MNPLDIKILYIGKTVEALISTLKEDYGFKLKVKPDQFEALAFLDKSFKQKSYSPDIILCESGSIKCNSFSVFLRTRKRFKTLKDIPMIVISNHSDKSLKFNALHLNADDFIDYPIIMENLFIRIIQLVKKHRSKNPNPAIAESSEYKTPIIKRAFDIFVSSALLLALTPIFLLIATAIRVESKGPIFFFIPTGLVQVIKYLNFSNSGL